MQHFLVELLQKLTRLFLLLLHLIQRGLQVSHLTLQLLAMHGQDVEELLQLNAGITGLS